MLVLAGVVGVLLLLRLLGGEDVARLQGRAEAAARTSDWTTALELWRRINATVGATAQPISGRDEPASALGRAAQAELRAPQGCRCRAFGVGSLAAAPGGLAGGRPAR